MHILKRTIRGLCNYLFKISVIFLAVSAATVTVFGSVAGLKSNIKDSGIYDKVVDGIVSQIKKDQAKKPNNESGPANDEISIDDPAVQEVIKKALPASFLETSANDVIDGVFGWLEGNTKMPEFTIELAEPKKQLAVGIGDVAYQKALALPVCTVSQLRTLNLKDLDINNIPCLPPGINLQTERDKFVETVANSNEFLSDTTITNEDLLKSGDKNGFDQASSVPTLYQLLVKLPYIFGALGILTGLGVVLLHDDRRRGLWVVGRTVLIAGIVLLLGVAISNYVINSNSIIKLNNVSEFEETARTLARLLAGDFSRVLMMFGIPYVILGAGSMLAIRQTRPKTTTHETAEKPNQTSTSTDVKVENPSVQENPPISNAK